MDLFLAGKSPSYVQQVNLSQTGQLGAMLLFSNTRMQPGIDSLLPLLYFVAFEKKNMFAFAISQFIPRKFLSAKLS
jgi:hypothetical protein